MKISEILKEAKQKLFVRFAAFSFFIVGLLVLVFYAGQLIPSQNKLLREKLFDRAKTISNLSSPIIVKALDTKDDITLLSQIDNMMKYVDDVNTVYILDNTGKVIAHNKTGEWGNVYSDKNITKSIKSKNDYISSTGEPKGFLYSHPLVSGDRIGTLFIGISSQKMSETLLAMIENDVFAAIPTFLIVVVVLVMFVSREITSPIVKFEKILNSILLGRGDEKICSYKTDEIGQIACKINSIIDKFSKDMEASLLEINSTKEKTALFITEMSKLFSEGLIITNSEDKVIFLNEKAASAISIDSTESIGKHLLDITSNSDFIELVKQSMKTSNKLIEETLDSLNITTRVITVNNGNDMIGTIIIFA